MTNKFPPTLREVAHRHAETIERLRTVLLDLPRTPSRGNQALDVSPAEGEWTASVLIGRLDLDESSPGAFLQQFKVRVQNSREATIFSQRPASHHA